MRAVLLAVLCVAMVSTAVEGQTSGGGATSALSVEVSSSASSVVSGAFGVTIRFASSVSGFSLGDIEVVNGTAGGFSGSGAVYAATVTPAADGSVVVRIPAGVARGSGGVGNAASSILVRTAALGGGASSPSGGPWIDTWDRAVVVSAYRQEFERTEPDAEFTGDLAGCVAGTTSQAFRDSELQRVNWYRRMSGLNAVTENAEYTIDAQHAALMMGAQGVASHYPDISWACYSAAGVHGALKSNLSVGANGVESIGNFMASYRHRQWVLSPYVEQIGMGDVFGFPPSGDGGRRYQDANALFVVGALGDGRDSLREARGFVAWPPAGYLPAAVVPRSWTFVLSAGADFSAASVTLTNDAGAIPIENIQAFESFRTSALVWQVPGTGEAVDIPGPTDGDECYTVTIRDVRVDGVTQAPYEYAICLLDLTEGSTVTATPVAPQNISVTDVAHDTVTLSWTLDPQPAAVTVSAYVVEQFDGTDWIERHRSSTAFSSFTATRLQALTEYRFRVRLVTTGGDTSATVAVTTDAAPIDGSSAESDGSSAESDGSSAESDGSPAETDGSSAGIDGSPAESDGSSAEIDGSPADIEVRIVARRLSSGRVEFALQQPLTDGGWSSRLLPARRFFPTGARVNRWLMSTPVAVTVDPASTGTEVRITARELADGRIEFGLQRRRADADWSDRVLPRRRFFPTTTQVGRWLVSTPMTLTIRTVETTDPVAAPGRPHVTATGGVNEIWVSWRADDNGPPITWWDVYGGGFGGIFDTRRSSYRWTGLPSGEYTIRVRACNDAGCGPEAAVPVTVVG